MKTGYRNLLAMTVMCLMMGAAANPARRSQDIEARRRSAVDRSLIRFGRSYPAEPSAADIREQLQRPVRRGTSFLRLGRSQPLTMNSDDLISLLRSYEEYEEPTKRGTTFMRLGRSPQFMRLGRSGEKSEEPGVYQERKSRARNQFLRLGRDSEEFNEDEEDEESRKKREACKECQA
ncbi:FMRFamide-related peptides-like isoform X1 [Cydia fagiglandana]|uniref:FMRFamide-related peptides-like isoform X1 n=1 Tax=Cydia fagiglandana TaxID=1458189 RepID=UPI002FEE2820